MSERRRVATILAAAILIAVGPPSSAQTAEPERLSFDEAIERAVERNHDVKRAAAAILAAEASLARARSSVLPSVELQVAETVIDAERSSGGLVFQPRDQLSIGASVEIPVLDASGWAAKAQAADRVEIARLGESEIRRLVSVATAKTYLTVIAAKRQVEVVERARNFAQELQDYAQTRLDAGAGTRLDALRAAEVRATNEAYLEQARATLLYTQEALGQLLAADGPVDENGEPFFEVPEAVAEPDLSVRTDLRLLDLRRAAADREVQDSWKDWVPEVVATFDPLYVDPAGAFQAQDTWRAVLAARFPLYLGGERAADRARREAALRDAEIQFDQAELQAQVEVRQARIVLDAARRALERTTEAAEHANEALSITDQAFRAGARTNIELVDAQRRARDAETNVTIAEDALRRAKLNLRVALGLFGSD